MCRNIRPLFNFDPPATDEEIRAATLPFIRKASALTKPSQANQAAFDEAVDEIPAVTARLMHQLHSTATPKNREIEAAKARARSAERFAS